MAGREWLSEEPRLKCVNRIRGLLACFGRMRSRRLQHARKQATDGGNSAPRKHEATLWVLALSLGALGFLAVGCSGGGNSVRQPGAGAAALQTQAPAAEAADSQATKAGAGAANKGNTPLPSSGVDGPKLLGKTVSEVLASAPGSQFLDGRHLAKGQTCVGCHGTLPTEGAPKPPDTAKCLSCHGGAYDVMGAKTAALGEMNPHNSHVGQTDCTNCHTVHRSFEYYCNACHTFGIPKRFRTE